MIQANELRIGNYIDTVNRSNNVHLPNNYPLKCYSINLFEIKVCNIEDNFAQVTEDGFKIVKTSDILGIPLTEEIFIKFGFKRFSFNKFSIGSFFIHFEGNLIMCVKSGVLLTTVHQLQNLYFAVTKQELRIKL